MASYDQQVFLNVPFDKRYQKLLDVLIFAVHDCGLIARCALEQDDGGDVRVEKLYSIIDAVRFEIHDLSRTTLDSRFRLPRFNMPFELGVFLGARKFGPGMQKRKSCLILDRDRHRYQVFCSDIAGQDIRAHGNNIGLALTVVRNWLRANVKSSRSLPGPSVLGARYAKFRRQLPSMCRQSGLKLPELTFLDYRQQVMMWIEVNPH
jgi:hypothetical protein